MVTMKDEHVSKIVILAFIAAALLILGPLSGAGWTAGVFGILGAVATLMVFWNYPSSSPTIQTIPETSEDKNSFLDSSSFSSILDGLSDPMLVVDKGKIALANRAAKALLGKHIMGEDARIAIRHPAAAQLLSSSRSIVSPEKVDISGLGNKDQRWSMRIFPIEYNGTHPPVLVHLVDQSAQQAVERARVDFVANASHELRTPLATIIGYVETLMDPEAGADSAVRQRFLSIVDSEARRMQELVDDLMSLSRIEADRYRLPDSLVDMYALSSQVVQEMRVSLGERGKDIYCTIQDGLYQLQGDRAQLSQLLHNLIDNAAKYGRTGTAITLALTLPSDQYMQVEVSDVGDGISEEHLPRLTERFFRADAGRSRSIGGTGLGLAIVKHVVDRHRGRMNISSVVGQGTCVSITLPRHEPAAQEASALSVLS